MGAVVVTVGRGNTAFVAPACINIVVAANAQLLRRVHLTPEQ